MSPAKKVRRPRALVTGASGGLGRLVCRRLHRTFDVVAVDKRPFPDRPKDVEHHELDLRRKSALLLLKKRRPDCIVHLGFQHDPRGSAGSFSFNVEGKEFKDFDEAYADLMEDSHDRAVSLFEAAADDSKDADVRNFAKSSLATLRQHSEAAEKLDQRDIAP